MTLFFFLYLALLSLWLLLIWPAFRLTRWSRIWLLLVSFAGALAAAREVWLFLGSVGAIRLDIIIISFVLLLLYVSAALVLAFRGWRRLASLLMLLLVLCGGGMFQQWSKAGGEAERLRGILEARNLLLFEAGFRSPAAYEAAYGPFSGDLQAHPVGHWLAGAEGRLTRVIINDLGQIWAFYRCGATECAYSSEGVALSPSDDGAGWQGVLLPTVGVALPVTLRQDPPSSLFLQLEGWAEESFATAPPPIPETPAAERLRYLGTFSANACRDGLVDLRQLWLWQEEDRLLAVGAFARLAPGRRHDFITPLVLGAAAEEEGRWQFTWGEGNEAGKASLSFQGEELDLTLELGNQAAVITRLKAGGLLQDPAIARAAVTDDAAWHQWFDTVLVGHFTSGVMPEC